MEMNMKTNLAHEPPELQATYQERMIEQKIRLLESALKANMEKPCLDNAMGVAKARYDLFDFLRGAV